MIRIAVSIVSLSKDMSYKNQALALAFHYGYVSQVNGCIVF